MLDDPRDCDAVEMAQVVVADMTADERDVVTDIFVVPGHIRREIGLHLEELSKVLIGCVQRLVEHRRANQDYLDIERDRLGPQRRDRHHAELFPHMLNPDLPAEQRPLERLPRERLAQDVRGVEDQ